jgi:hypothetical protein
MTSTLVVLLFGAFFLKHFICDFPLQPAYQYKNKGTYGHLGGIVHAGIHAIGTFIVLLAFIPFGHGTIAIMALIDGLVHYHIDWAKMNVNSYCKLTPTNSEFFWHLLGLDQLLHYLTYFGIILYLV